MESKTMTKIGAPRYSMPLARVQSPTLAAKPWMGQGTGVEIRVSEIAMTRVEFLGGTGFDTPVFAGSTRVPRAERPPLR